MLHNIKKWYKRQQFQPSWYSLSFLPYYIIRRALYLHIRDLAPNISHGRLLDFGCGSKPYKNLFAVNEYTGIDIENTGHPHDNEEIDVYYDGQTIPFPECHFDSLLCSEVLEHVFEPDQILKEINRVLKPGAKCLFTTPFVWNEHEVPWDYARYSSYGLPSLLEKNGFEIIESRKTTHAAETLSQMAIVYIYQLVETRWKYLNLLFCILFIFPLNLLGLITTWILPKKWDFYHNVVVFAEKK